jgi:hypothetical protein
VVTANRLAIAGLCFLAVAMTGAIVLITSVLFGTATTVAAAVFMGGAFAVLWYGLPLRESRGR